MSFLVAAATAAAATAAVATAAAAHSNGLFKSFSFSTGVSYFKARKN